MERPFMFKGILLIISVLACGCVSQHPFNLAKIQNKEGIRLLKIAPVKQEQNGYCGVACLEEVLYYWGKPVRQKEIWDSITKGEKDEIIAKELREYAEQVGLKGFIFKGNIHDIGANIEKGRPLIIAHESTGFLRGLAGKNDYHYVVVVGYNKVQDYYIIDDPAQNRYWMLSDKFEKMWASGFNFLMLVAPEEKGGDTQ